MARRTCLFISTILYFVNLTNAYSLQHVMARLNILETKFDMENKLMRSDIEELFRRVSEISESGKMITASEHVSRDASSNNGEHVSPKELVEPLSDRTTILPYADKNKNKTKQRRVHSNFQKLESYLIEGAKNEKDENLKLRTELKDIGNMLKTDYTILESNIKEEIRSLTNNLSENQKSLEINYASFTSNIEAKINNLTSHLSKNQKSLEIDYASFKSNIMDNFNDFNHDISENQLLSVERFDIFKDYVTTALAIARNESRQTILSLKSEFDMSVSEISNNVSTVSKTLANIHNRLAEIGISKQELSNDLSSVNKTLTNIPRLSCRNSPYSGVYDIYLGGKSASSVRVYCDQTTDGGGWIVFQRRQDGSVDFERTWADYKTGFGNLEGEFWLGNDNIHALTSAGFNELRIDLEDFEGNRRYAKYSHFKVKSENEKYELEVRLYSGDAGDSLIGWHNGMSFSTKDQDNDKWNISSCALSERGAWWYRNCHQSNLNGFYYNGANSPAGQGVIWWHWRRNYNSLKRVEMKIR